MLQILARCAAFDRGPHPRRFGEHMVDIVAEVIDPRPLAAALKAAVGQGGDEQRGLSELMARDAERLVIGKTLDPKVERQSGHDIGRHQ